MIKPSNSFNQNGFAIVEAILVVVIIAMVGFTCWFVWNGKQAADKTLSDAAKTSQNGTAKVTAKPVATFAECKASQGSIMQETYPETCVTKIGKRFTDTASSSSNLISYTSKQYGINFEYPSMYVVDEVDCSNCTSATKQLYAVNVKVNSNEKYSERVSFEVLGEPSATAQSWYDDYYKQSPLNVVNKTSGKHGSLSYVLYSVANSGNQDKLYLFDLGDKTVTFQDINVDLRDSTELQLFNTVFDTIAITR